VKLPHPCLTLRLRRIALAAMTLCIAAAGMSMAVAEQVYSFDRAPGRLPKTVIPMHYAIELEPDLENLALAGTEIVDIDVREPTDRIVLNAVGMVLGDASIDASGASVAITLDAAAETATLALAQPLAAGAHKLRITFRAEINKFARGVFLVDYQTAKGIRRMISSHLEPADARRVFPCWDEPAFKASVALTVTVPLFKRVQVFVMGESVTFVVAHRL
jgi:aminopeptidase N